VRSVRQVSLDPGGVQRLQIEAKSSPCGMNPSALERLLFKMRRSNRHVYMCIISILCMYVCIEREREREREGGRERKKKNKNKTIYKERRYEIVV